MIFADASAIVAIVAREADGQALAAKLDAAPEAYISPMVQYESILALARIGRISIDEATATFDGFVERLTLRSLAIDSAIAQAAVEAFARYGKGRHRANLNMGDCFAYACAKTLDAALLCKGDDFLHTDVRLA